MAPPDTAAERPKTAPTAAPGIVPTAAPGAVPDTVPTAVPSTAPNVASPVQAQPPPELPAQIFVNRGNQVVTWQRYYVLHDGRIWWKPNPENWRPIPASIAPPATDANAQTPESAAPTPSPTLPPDQWQLLGGTGMPFSTPEHPITVPDHIVSFSADDDFLTAVDDAGYLYHFQGTYWTDVFGLPSPVLVEQERLKLPENTAHWALSIRYKNVLYYEDILGNQFNWGAAGCTTFFALDRDGQQIRQGDPWFPPDFSRQMCGPKRGAVVAANLSSSASTTFLISKTGALYTRFYDYDSNGGTPFFRYRYGDAPRHKVPGSDPASEQEIRALPPEDWKEEPRIEPVGQTHITRNIVILQTGQGNHARELRVQGIDAQGRSGYFFKALDADVWQFRETGEPVLVTDLLPNEFDAGPRPADEARTRDRALTGRILVGARADTRIMRVDAPDFNFHCTPFTLVLSLANGERIPLFMHTVDAWTLFKETDPELDPFAVKRLKGTLEIPPEILASTDPLTREVLRTYFLDSQQKSFAWAIVSTRDAVRLYRVSYPLGGVASNFEIQLSSSHLETEGRFAQSLKLYSSSLRTMEAEKNSPLLPPGPVDPISQPLHSEEAIQGAPASDSINRSLPGQSLLNTPTGGGLAAKPFRKSSPAIAPSPDALIERIRTLDGYRTALITSREELAHRRNVSRGLLWGLPAATSAADLLSLVTTARYTVDSMTTLRGMEEHMPALLSSTRQGYEALYENSEQDYRQTLASLEKELCQDVKLLARQEKVAVPVLIETHPELPGWASRACR